MDDIVVLKTILKYFDTVDSTSLIQLLTFILVGINISRILGILEIIKWVYNVIINKNKHRSNTNHSDLVASLYTDVFNNHLLFNNRLSDIVDDLTDLRNEINAFEIADTVNHNKDLHERISKIEVKVINLERKLTPPEN